jgi:hypothetical protein
VGGRSRARRAGTRRGIFPPSSPCRGTGTVLEHVVAPACPSSPPRRGTASTPHRGGHCVRACKHIQLDTRLTPTLRPKCKQRVAHGVLGEENVLRQQMQTKHAFYLLGNP